MTIQIEEMTESEYRFRIVNIRSGYEEKAYSLQGALRLANSLMADEIMRQANTELNNPYKELAQ